jgi:hypothetical protein
VRDLVPRLSGSGGEARVIACLDRSTSMVRFDKYALVAELYPRSLAELAAAAPGAWVETWWFAAEVSRYAPLAPVGEAQAPERDEYRRALEAGSAISDCVIHAVERAEELRSQRGDAPTKVVVWTDGWNRHARSTPRAARESMEGARWVDVYLIGFVDRSILHRLEDLASELALPADRVFVFGHSDDAHDTRRAAEASGQAFNETLTSWRQKRR